MEIEIIDLNNENKVIDNDLVLEREVSQELKIKTKMTETRLEYWLNQYSNIKREAGFFEVLKEIDNIKKISISSSRRIKGVINKTFKVVNNAGDLFIGNVYKNRMSLGKEIDKKLFTYTFNADIIANTPYIKKFLETKLKDLKANKIKNNVNIEKKENIVKFNNHLILNNQYFLDLEDNYYGFLTPILSFNGILKRGKDLLLLNNSKHNFEFYIDLSGEKEIKINCEVRNLNKKEEEWLKNNTNKELIILDNSVGDEDDRSVLETMDEVAVFQDHTELESLDLLKQCSNILLKNEIKDDKELLDRKKFLFSLFVNGDICLSDTYFGLFPEMRTYCLNTRATTFDGEEITWENIILLDKSKKYITQLRDKLVL